MAQQYDVTSVGVNPTEDRSRRMRMYFLTMSLRMACIVSLFWVRGYWIILVGIGAVVLPYVAVLIANAVSHEGGNTTARVEPLELTSVNGDTEGQAAPRAGEQLIIIDEVPLRRSEHPEEGQ